MLVKRWAVCSHNGSRWADISEIVCGWAWYGGCGALNWVERRRFGGGVYVTRCVCWAWA